MTHPAQAANRSPVHLVLGVGGISGLVSLFLPFAYGYSPMEGVLDEDLWPLAAPFFGSALISLAVTRRIVSGSFSRTERLISYLTSIAMAGVIVSMFLSEWPTNLHEWIALTTPGAILLCGAYLVIGNLRCGDLTQFSPIMALQVAYLSNCLGCLVAFFPFWEAGAYWALVAAVTYVVQIILSLSIARRADWT